MVNPQIFAYIREQTTAGVAREEISKALITAGWQLSDINDALAASLNPQPVQKTVVTPPVVQTPVQMPAQTPVQTPARSMSQPVNSHGHRWVWAIVSIVLLLIIAGGAFAAYRYGVFTSLMSLVSPAVPPETTVAPVIPSDTTGTPPIYTPPPVASSTLQEPPTMGSSTPVPPPAVPLPPAVLNMPTATLTINNAPSVVASASAFTLKWSSTNADTFSATQSIANCVIPVMNRSDIAMNALASVKGTNSSLIFTKNDLALLSGCNLTITYTAEDAKTAQRAQAAVNVSFPSDATTTQQLINMTSLKGK